MSSPVPTATRAPAIRDIVFLLGIGLLLIGAGLGLRDPWPADEPRFALAARDMVESGQWLFPRVGGDLYPDKPPLFMWLIGLFYLLTGSLRLSFLLPSLLAALGTLVLIYDLGRRLWNREAGRWAALALLFTIQFTLQAKRAQIDMVLVFWTTLSLYGFLRYLLLGHDLRWLAVGGFAAGLGVISKGVGFLPLLIFVPYAYARSRQWKLPPVAGRQAWTVAPLAFVAAIALWLVPMVLTSILSEDPALAAYRNEILFQQTAERYVAAWHHHKPFYYYLTVIASLWLPLAGLLPWLLPRWMERLRAHDARVLLPLAWIVLVILFFSFSPGKRGVYIFPALPAFALLAGEWLRGLAQRADVQRTAAIFALLIVAACTAALVYFTAIAPERADALRSESGLNVLVPLVVLVVLGAAVLLAYGKQHGVRACAYVLGSLWLVAGLIVTPQINRERSARSFVERLESLARTGEELGLLGYKEQFLLYLTRPTVNFGHSRWREAEQENHDAAAWLNARAGRRLVLEEDRLKPCFETSRRIEVGQTSDERWYLVDPPAENRCAAWGNPQRAIRYRGPAE